jgi:TRAP-type mannitol/chloroaromatic compound transport system substrate-binding protein
LGGQVLAKLGVVPQQIAGGDIYPSLERGVLDAAEFVGPYDDEKLGLSKVAKYYYAPGWWEGGAMLHLCVNQAKWNELPKAYQAIVFQACEAANNWMLAKYDFVNAQALRRMVGRRHGAALLSAAHSEACPQGGDRTLRPSSRPRARTSRRA